MVSSNKISKRRIAKLFGVLVILGALVSAPVAGVIQALGVIVTDDDDCLGMCQENQAPSDSANTPCVELEYGTSYTNCESGGQPPARVRE